MKVYSHQKGVGLMEVLVALLVLAVGVLGFVALQYRAIEASSEGEYRIQAINVARDLAEKIRINPEGLTTYASAISSQADATQDCYTSLCTTNQKATFDAAQTTALAQRNGMTINMFECPGVANKRQCIYVSWGDTAAVNADGLDNCTTDGVYRPESTCVVMEAY